MVSDSAATPRPPDVLDLLWRYAGGNLTTSALCALLALMLALAAVFPQLPAGLSGAPAEFWLANTSAAYGGLGSIVRSLGLFQVFSGLPLRLILALAAYHLLLRLARQVRYAYGLWRPKSLPLPPARLAPLHVVLAGPLDAAAQRAGAVLQEEGYARVAAIDAGPAQRVVYGVRAFRASAGPLLAYGGALLALIALALNASAGWSAEGVALAPGSTAAPAQAGGLQVRMEGLSGSDRAPLTTVLLTAVTGQTARAQVGFNRPAMWGNLWIAQQATGPALAVTAQDTQGRPVLLETAGADRRPGEAAHVLFTATQTEQAFAAPARNLAFRVVSYPALPERGIPETVFLVEAYRGAELTPAVSQLVRGQATLRLDDVTYRLQEERHAVLALAYLPGLWLLLPGTLLLLAGVTICLRWGQRETWVSLAAHGEEVAVSVRTAALVSAGAERSRLARSLASAAAPVARPDAGEPAALGVLETRAQEELRADERGKGRGDLQG